MTSRSQLQHAARPVSPAEETETARSGRSGEKRRDQIVKTAVRLFSQKGYFQTTIDDIAREARVSKGLVYLYFKDKNDVLYYAVRFALDVFEREMSSVLGAHEDPLMILRTALRTYCRLIDAHRPETVLAYRSTKDLSPEHRLQIKLQESKAARLFRKCLEACIHKGILESINIDVLVYQYIMFAHTWALKHWAFREKYPFEEYLADGERILIDGFLTAHGRELASQSQLRKGTT